MATLKVDQSRLPYLEDLALTLENEGGFYRTYQTRDNSLRARDLSLRARDLIHKWDLKTASQRGIDTGAASTTADEREFLRRYFNKKWGLSQPGSGSRDLCDGPGFPLFQQPVKPAPVKPFEELWPKKPKPATPELATDWYALPNGTTLITADGTRYIKGPTEKYMEDQVKKGYVVGTTAKGGWNRWNKDGKSCDENGVVSRGYGLHLVSYELPVKPPTFDLAKTPFKQIGPVDYSQLPDGTRLFTKGGGEYIKGRPPEDLEGLTEAMRKPCFYVNSSGSGRPVYGYKARDGKFIGWQNWSADGTLGSVSTGVRDLELTGYDATPSGGLMPATNLNPIDRFAVYQNATQPKEDIMNAIITITTKTLVNGQDVANFSNAQLYDLIAQQEKKLAELDAIKNKPKALKKELADRQAGIDALVAHLDSRDDSAAK